METTQIWLTRYGTPYEKAIIGQHNVAPIKAINLKKGTAQYEYQQLCGRCGGAGGFRHWPGFTCFDCNGQCMGDFTDVALYTPQKLAKLNAAQEIRDAKKAAKRQAELQAQHEAAVIARKAFIDANSEAFNAITAYADKNDFLFQMAQKLEQYGTLSERQLTAAMQAVERCKAQEQAHDCPTGRVLVTGTVLSTDRRETEFGTVLKMMVQAVEGFKVWCTVPTGSPVCIEKGSQIAFKATLTPSEKDPKFGFGSRPTLAKVTA